LLSAGCVGIASAEGWAPPVEAGGRVYVQVESGEIAAVVLEGGTAREVWRYPSQDGDPDLDAVYAAPVYADGVLYIAGHRGIVVALDAETGRPLAGWGEAPDLGAQIVATPVFDGGRLFVATEAGDVFAVDAASGEATRLFEGEGRIWGGMTARDGLVFVGNMDARLVMALDASTGSTAWVEDLPGAPVG